MIGCGKWGRFVLRDLKVLGAKVCVVARSAESVQRATEGGADHIVESIEDLPAGIEGAIVVTPTVLHADSIERLLPRGIPVFTEKALTANAADARRLLTKAPDRIFVMDKWRYHPGVEHLAAIARSGELGPVRSIRTTRHGWGSSHTDVDPVWILTPHDLSIILEILGYLPEPVAASAVSEDGNPVELAGLLGSDPWAAISISARDPVNRRAVTVCCANGSALLADSYSSHIVIRRAAGIRAHADDPSEARPLPNHMPLLLELRAFLGHLRGGPPPRRLRR